MQLFISCVIGGVLGLFGICVIDFDPIRINFLNSGIVIGSVLIWNLFYSVIAKKE
ncbi:MAG: hypothetical protein AB7V16_07065 [Vulcanibacillus sp.]